MKNNSNLELSQTNSTAKVESEEEYVIELSTEEVEEIENAPKKEDENFMIIPSDENKTMIIASTTGSGRIELNVKKAKALIAILNHQIQLWK